MSALGSHFLLIDLQTSWKSANQVPIAYLHNSAFLRRTPPRTRKPVASSLKSSPPSFPFPEIRRPSDFPPSGNGSPSNSPALPLDAPAAAELELFLDLVPARMRTDLYAHAEIGNLIEVVMDLGRQPIARFPSGDWVISEQPVQLDDLSHAISKVGEFSDDNRSGINSSLHRISAIRNRKMEVIGLTCRVGRAVSGSAKTVHDLVAGGGSILVIGPPGVGKTTLIREIARMLADEHGKRVVIVDTSNEIGGDGDVPHAGIGRARRMQVPNVHMQHSVMIEAVENHMPQTIIIDEIGTELEALAASTIAQRGVQLVGTAHGITIDSIIKNPSLQILVGGIESVTLGDEMAKKRKVQKTVLERKGPPAFTCAVELISKTECRVHHKLDATVDAILAGKSPLVEIRNRNGEASESLKLTSTRKNQVKELELANSQNLVDEVGSYEDAVDYTSQRSKKSSSSRSSRQQSSPVPVYSDKKLELDISKNSSDEVESDEDAADHTSQRSKKSSSSRSLRRKSSPVSVYSYKILEADLLQVAKVMGHQDKVGVTDDIGKADAILVSSQELEQNPWIRGVAKFYKLPVYVLKTNTMAQMVKAVGIILEMESNGSKSKKSLKSSPKIEIEGDAPKRKPSLEEMDALEEVRVAIEYIVIPGGEPVELLPRPSDIVARQLELVESYQLAAENAGTESNPRLQILPQRLIKKSSSKTPGAAEKDESFKAPSGRRGGTTVARLPILPE